MKKNLFITTLLLMAVAMPAMAIVDLNEAPIDESLKRAEESTRAEEVLKNRGYSEQMARLITVKAAQAAGEIPEIQDEPDYRKKFNWVRKFFIYLDPALDDEPFLQHDIHATPSVHDL